MASTLSFDNTVGSPFKGHSNQTKANAARAPFGDLTNDSASKASINDHMQSTWNFHKLSKSKTGELGMETFKKFLEKKKGGRNVGGDGGLEQKMAPSENEPALSAAPPAKIPQRSLSSLEDGTRAFPLGSPEHRIQVQNAESAKSPWSYQLQVPLWPLNMTLALSVQEEEEQKLNEMRLQEEYLSQAKKDGHYLKERVFSVAQDAAMAANATVLPGMQTFNGRESKFVMQNKINKENKKNHAKPKPLEEEEIKLPTPTFLKNREASVIDVESQQVQAPQPAEPLPEANPGVEGSCDIEAVALFPMEREEDVVMDCEMQPTEASVCAPVETALAEAPAPIVSIDLRQEAPPAPAPAPAPVEKQAALVRSKPPPPPPRTAAAAKTESKEENLDQEVPTESLTIVNPLVHQFCVTPIREIKTIEAVEEEMEEDSESSAVVLQEAIEFLDTNATTDAAAASTNVEVNREQAAAETISRAFRSVKFRNSSMRAMAKVRDCDQKLRDLVGSGESNYQNLHDEYATLASSASSLLAPDALKQAVRLSSEMECAIQALVDSSEKTKKYQRAYKKYQRAYKKHQELERASTVIQRWWRSRSAAIKREGEERVVASVRRTMAAVVIQNTWRKYWDFVLQCESFARSKDATPITSSASGLSQKAASGRASVSPVSLNVTPVSNWADAVEAASNEKKKKAEEERAAAAAAPEQAHASKEVLEELASLRKELEILRSEVKSTERVPHSKRGRSATRHRSKNRYQRGFSASRASAEGGKIANGDHPGQGAKAQQPKKSRSVSRGRRRRRNKSVPPALGMERGQNQMPSGATVTEKAQTAAPTKKRNVSRSRKHKGKENQAAPIGGEAVMTCPPPGLCAPPGLRGLAKFKHGLNEQSAGSRSHLAQAFYHRKKGKSAPKV